MDEDLKQIFTFLQRPFRLLGLDVLDPNWKVTPLTLFTFGMFVVQHYASYLFLISHLDQFDVFTECFSVSAVGLEISLRMCLLFYHRELLQETIEAIRNQKYVGLFRFSFNSAQFGVFLPNSTLFRNSESFKNLTSQFYKRVSMALHTIAVIYLSTMMFELIPIVSPNPQKNNLPLAVYLPFIPSDVAPYWHLNYVFHTFINFMCVMFLLAVDGTLVMSILAAIYQIKGLKLCLQELDTRADRQELHRELVYILQTHISIKQFIRQLERTYQLDLLVDFGLVCLILCMGLNVIAVDMLQPIWFFLVSVAFQLFLLCFCGNLLLIESDSLANCAYAIEWQEMPVPEQKLLMLLMAHAQPPQELNGIFMPLAMSSFLSESYLLLLPVGHPVPLDVVNTIRESVVCDQQQAAKVAHDKELQPGRGHQRIHGVLRCHQNHVQAHAYDDAVGGKDRKEVHLERVERAACELLRHAVQLDNSIEIRVELFRTGPRQPADLLVQLGEQNPQHTDPRADAHERHHDDAIDRRQMVDRDQNQHHVVEKGEVPDHAVLGAVEQPIDSVTPVGTEQGALLPHVLDDTPEHIPLAEVKVRTSNHLQPGARDAHALDQRLEAVRINRDGDEGNFVQTPDTLCGYARKALDLPMSI
uniref:Odorant receptor n=1 Tax=Anopheles farauti TaxID=69004 RepID=A0A182QIF4_9DIPT